MPALAFGVLGPTTATADAGPLDLRGAVRRRLLTRLLLAAGRPVPAGVLIEDVWGSQAPATAPNTLRSHVTLLRKVIGTERLRWEHGAYVLQLDPDSLDAGRFETELALARAALREPSIAEGAQRLASALAYWRGQAYADADGAEWALSETSRLEELRAGAVESWLAALLSLGEHDEVIARAEAAIAGDPLREGQWSLLVVALYRSGRQSDALRAVTRARTLLREEMGLDPGPELVAVERAVLAQDLALLPPGLAIAAPPPVLGRPASQPAPGPVPGNLPAELDSFVGRTVELREVAALLERERLVTLAGPGGIGKTRLALRLGHRWAGDDAVWFAELAAISDAGGVLGEIARAVGVRDTSGPDLLDAVLARLGSGRHVIIVDNCEHQITAAGRAVARILASVPAVRILATSRQPLGVSGETTYRVRPMAVPAMGARSADALAGCDAVALFVDRAQRHERSFTVEDSNATALAAVCRRLDGIPLAVEMAAARVGSMSLADIERGLDRRFRFLANSPSGISRQQTLQALVDWSYALLTDSEKVVAERLAVFAGGWDLDGASTAVAATGLDAWDAMEILSSLVDKSVVVADTRSGPTRYWMLETIREYLLQRLGERGDEVERAARDTHAQLMLRLAEEAVPHFRSGLQLTWRQRMAAERENLLVAFDRLLLGGNAAEAVLRFAVAMSWFWTATGAYVEGVRMTMAALDAAGDDPPPRLRAAALNTAGHLLGRSGQVGEADRCLAQGLAIGRELGDPELIADALRSQVWVAQRRGGGPEAVALADEAVAAAVAGGSAYLLSRALEARAFCIHPIDAARARRDFADALASCRIAGDGLGEVSILNNLGVLELGVADTVAARQHFGAGLDAAARAEDLATLPYLEYGVGLSYLIDSDAAAARDGFRRALHHARTTGQRSVMAYILLGLALAASEQGRSEEAALLHGAAEKLFADLQETPEPLEAAMAATSTARLRAATPEVADRLIEQGRRLSTVELLALIEQFEIAAADHQG